MLKLNVPLTIALSSGGYFLLFAIGSLLLMSNTVHTSEIQTLEKQSEQVAIIPNSNQSSSTVQPEAAQPSSGSFGNPNTRRRSGRMHTGTTNYGGSGHQQQQTTIDNYAAAYANLPAEQAQSNAQANDASTFSSFGEPAPNSVGSTARQLASPSSATSAGAGADYGQAHANYYANYMSPSSSDATYSSGHSGIAGGSPGYIYSQPQTTTAHYYNHHKAAAPLGYPTAPGYGDRHSASSYYERMPSHGSAASPFLSGFSSGPSSSFGGGLMSSASSALSHWTNGFTLSEIICGLVAVTIGAIILGAPFFLIYLALMGNFSGSGTLSLTNPLQGTTTAGGASTTVSGRRKRLAILEPLSEKHIKNPDVMAIAESIVSHLSPFVNFRQVSDTFKQLLESVEKFSDLAGATRQSGVKLKQS